MIRRWKPIPTKFGGAHPFESLHTERLGLPLDNLAAKDSQTHVIGWISVGKGWQALARLRDDAKLLKQLALDTGSPRFPDVPLAAGKLPIAAEPASVPAPADQIPAMPLNDGDRDLHEDWAAFHTDSCDSSCVRRTRGI